METKDQLVTHVKRWITVDEEIRVLQKQIKNKHLQKKSLFFICLITSLFSSGPL